MRPKKPLQYYAAVDSTGETHIVLSSRTGIVCAMVSHLPASGPLKARKEVVLSASPNQSEMSANRIRANGHTVDIVPVRLIDADEAKKLRPDPQATQRRI